MLKHLNNKKTIIVVILTAILAVLMMLPLANYTIAPELISQLDTEEKINSSGTIHLYDGSKAISTMKNVLGMDEIDISDIDKNNVQDSMEQTILDLYEINKDFNMALALIIFSIIALIISVMYIYVNPNGWLGSFGLLAVPVSVWLAGYYAANAVQSINRSIDGIAEYFGLEAVKDPVSFHLSSVFYAVIGLGVILFLIKVILKKPKQTGNEAENLTKAITFLCAVVAVLSVIFIMVFLFSKGIPTIKQIGFTHFIFGNVWDPVGEKPKFGIANLILTSLFGTIGAIIIGIPIGILVAVFIAELSPAWLSSILRSAVNLLAGIPSVIYGAVGAVLLVPFVQNTFDLSTGSTLFSAIIVLSIMILPSIIGVSETSLRSVPKTYMEASLALGVTKEASIFRIIVPAAKSGIMTGALLGLGRAIGEAMAIILVAGNIPQFPELFKPVRFLTTGIVAEMGYANGLHRDALFAIGLVLFVFILILNSVFRGMIKKAHGE